MREIKFRVWYGVRMWMPVEFVRFSANGFGIGFKPWETAGERPHEYIETPSGVDVMQYTGLKDKNGTEIYEGDVLDVKDWKKYVVGGSVENLAEFYYENIEFSICEGSEVTGNIYENPELLSD